MSNVDGWFIFHKLSNLFSLWLTAPTILLSTMVCLKWYPEALIAFKTPPKIRTSTQWFILGVAMGFFGSIIHNCFLCVIWVSIFFNGNDMGDYLFYNKVYSNIISQTAGVFAAYCHIKAALQYSSDKESSVLKTVCLLSIVGGFAFVLTLVYLAVADLNLNIY